MAFADAGAVCFGQPPLSAFPRLQAEVQGPPDALLLDWQARGEVRAGANGEPTRWLHLGLSATLPLTCQRCLAPVSQHLASERWFRFVADEATAEAQDDEAEEDLLVESREFDLHALVEDEFLMALPMVVLHDVCPGEVCMAVADADFEAAAAAKPNPFAALESWQRKP